MTAELAWREHLRAHPAASDWQAAIGHELSRLEVLSCQRASSGAPELCGVHRAMGEAEDAIVQRRESWDRVRVWWSGWDAERAWRAVHSAEVALVARCRDLAGRLSGIREQVARELPGTDGRLQALLRLEPAAIIEADRATPSAGEGIALSAPRAIVCEALDAAFAAADDALRRVRILRNQMLIFGTVLVLLNLLLGVIGSMNPRAIPLCVPETICPTGGSAVSAGDVWQVQLFGVLGATIAVVVLLINRQPKLITYALTSYQSLVKIALGATLAVVGVLGLAINAIGFVPENSAGLLMAALVFGYAQQIATRFLDKTAGNLVSKAKTGAAHRE